MLVVKATVFSEQFLISYLVIPIITYSLDKLVLNTLAITLNVLLKQYWEFMEWRRKKKKVKPWSQCWLIAAGAYPGFCSMKRLEVFLLPLDGMLVHRRSLSRNFARFLQQFAGTQLYTWVERGTVRVKCLAQEHNTMSQARARTRTARSGVERTNHEATEVNARYMVRCTVCTSSCRLLKCSNSICSYYRISLKFCWGNFDRATLFSATPTNNNIETTPLKKFITNLRKWKNLIHVPGFPTSTVKPKTYGDKTQMSFVREACVALFLMWLLNFQMADTCTLRIYL